MRINESVKKEFRKYGYEDARLGRKIADADYFILSEAKSYVHNHFEKIYMVIDKNISKLNSINKTLNLDSDEIQMWKKYNNNKKVLDEIDEAIKILNNEIREVEKEINDLSCFEPGNSNIEIENTFGLLLYQYEKGYLTYKYEQGNDQIILPGEINYSSLTTEIIDQYYKNLEQGNNILD